MIEFALGVIVGQLAFITFLLSSIRSRLSK